MNPLQRALIEKAGHDNGFEYVLPGDAQHAALASALHPTRVRVTVTGLGFEAAIANESATLAQELARTFTENHFGPGTFALPSEAQLARWLRRAAALSQALPNQAVTAFEQQVQAELAELAPPVAQSTEVLRMVRQRLGQRAYRQAMLDYWGGACAVTGLALAPVLRASHAKPWAECADDAERLDAFNGFLLVANLDALFDRFLISFDDAGHLLTSTRLSQSDLPGLGIHSGMTLRWLASEHRHYLQWHRERFLLGA